MNQQKCPINDKHLKDRLYTNICHEQYRFRVRSKYTGNKATGSSEPFLIQFRRNGSKKSNKTPALAR